MKINTFTHVAIPEHATFLALQNDEKIFKVLVNTGLANVLTVYCSAYDEQDAVDTVINYLERNDKIFIYEEAEVWEMEDISKSQWEKNEDILFDRGYVCGGNNDLYISIANIEELDAYPEELTVEAEEFIEYIDNEFSFDYTAKSLLENILKYVEEHFEYNYDKKAFFESMISCTGINLNYLEMSICKAFRV